MRDVSISRGVRRVLADFRKATGLTIASWSGCTPPVAGPPATVGRTDEGELMVPAITLHCLVPGLRAQVKDARGAPHRLPGRKLPRARLHLTRTRAAEPAAARAVAPRGAPHPPVPQPARRRRGGGVRPPGWRLGLSAVGLAVAMAALQASIGAANDVVDVAADAQAKPDKPIPAGLVSRRPAAAAVAVVGGVLGLGIVAVGYDVATLAGRHPGLWPGPGV